jgi:xanthine dehydrogenase YagT iron-sulfur-binding subunit
MRTFDMTRRDFVAGASLTTLALESIAVRPAQAAGSLAMESGAVPLVLEVNGTKHPIVVETRVTLLDAVRNYIGLTGAKKGCDRGACGACTMIVNGRRINSCLTLAVMHENDAIVTVEGLAGGEGLHPMQAAFIKHDAFQCGYCTSGQIVSAVAFTKEGGALDRDAVRTGMSGNLCRCGCYPRIVDAVLEASQP